MIEETIQKALKSLRAEREELDRAIDLLEAPAKKRKVRAGSIRHAVTKRRASRQRGQKAQAHAPRPLLKEKVHAVLKAATRPLMPTVVAAALTKGLSFDLEAQASQSLRVSVARFG